MNDSDQPEAVQGGDAGSWPVAWFTDALRVISSASTGWSAAWTPSALRLWHSLLYQA